MKRQQTAHSSRLTDARLTLLRQIAHHLDAGGADDLRSVADALGLRPANLLIHHLDCLADGGYVTWQDLRVGLTAKGLTALAGRRVTA